MHYLLLKILISIPSGIRMCALNFSESKLNNVNNEDFELLSLLGLSEYLITIVVIVARPAHLSINNTLS